MSDKKFIDTNVLIYAYSSDEPDKQAIVEKLAETGSAWISTQVISEFSNVLRKRFNQNYPTIADAVAELTAAFHVITVTLDTIRKALALAGLYRYSYYDSLILASALEAGCTTLYTEDLQHGQVIGSILSIQNPFKAASSGGSAQGDEPD